MCTSPVLLLCKLCSTNASISVESRNNILLSQLLFFSFSVSLFFFFPPLPKQCTIQHWWNFLKAEQHYTPLRVFHMFHSTWNSCAVEKQFSTCWLWKCCLVLPVKEEGPYLMFLMKIAICIVCTAHASEFPCLLTSEFHIVTVGIRLWSDERLRKHTEVW